MAYRYTNTEKWGDTWFSNLSQLEMLLFIYLCDNCDIAGFIEVNLKRWAADLSSTQTQIDGALKGLQRGFIYSNEGDCLFIRNFLKHQKNLPLQENNKAHIGIKRRFKIYSDKFSIFDVDMFLEGASKGLQSPTGIGNGNGIGNGIGNGKKRIVKKELNNTWKNDFSIYLDELNNAIKEISTDAKWIAEQESYNTNVDIMATIQKSVAVYWGVETEGYLNKKKSKGDEINWRSTFAKNLDKNIVWKSKRQVTDLPIEQNSFAIANGLVPKPTPQEI